MMHLTNRTLAPLIITVGAPPHALASLPSHPDMLPSLAD